MPLARRLRDLMLCGVSALASFALVSSPGCGTSAVGIEDCRDIEQARCDAALACGTIIDAGECKQFYRDHCLHGLPTAAPAREEVDGCIGTIKNLTFCVNAFGQDAELVDCNPPIPAENATRVCEVVAAPEKAYACAFLADKPVTPPTAGQGGQAGSE